MLSEKRNLIFISHATPEDNTFTIWLSARLKLMGYQIWSDVTQLFGGEKWWGDIEQAVDQYTCKFVLVITKTSLSKPGVQREIELALAAEKKHNHNNFIIPIIIDDSKFGGQPYELSERNIISFSSGWATGFVNLVERLTRDSVPAGEISNNLGKKLSDLSSPPLIVNRQDDLILSNLLKVLSIPKQLNFYRLPIDSSKWRKTFEGSPFVWFEWGGMLASFAVSDDLKQFLPRHFIINEAPSLNLNAVLKRSPRNHPTFLRGEVIKKVNYLLVEAWHIEMRKLGMHRYELASGKVSWFFPDSDDYRGKKPFADIFGVVRKKQVIGYSKKNSVYWHYAIEPKVQYGANPRFSLVPHVVFTMDGKNPLDDKDKMHQLRRGFCKSWWNFRWRDLLLGYMNLVSLGKQELEIALGTDKTLICESRPQIIQSNYALIAMRQVENIDNYDEVVDVEVCEE